MEIYLDFRIQLLVKWGFKGVLEVLLVTEF